MPPVQPYADVPPSSSYNRTPVPVKSGSKLGVSIAVGMVVALVILCAGGAWRATRSGIVVDGRELSKKEAKQGLAEVKTMMASVKPGTTTVDTSIETTSPLSNKVKEFYNAINKSESKLEAFMKTSPLEAAMDGSLNTKAQRKAARDAAIEYDKALYDYFDEEIATLKNYQVFVRSAFKMPADFNLSQIPRMEGLKVSYQKISKARLAFLDFLDEHPPQTEGDNPFVYETQAEVDELKRRAETMINAGEAYDKLYAQGAQQQEDAFSQAMKKLDDL